jgi:site-specific recombinase XerC
MANRAHEWLESFLEMQAAERGAAANTVAAYRCDLQHFLSYLDSRGGSLTSAKSADIAAYQRNLSEAGMAASTRARRLSAVRQLFKFLAVVRESPTRHRLFRAVQSDGQATVADLHLDAAIMIRIHSSDDEALAIVIQQPSASVIVGVDECQIGPTRVRTKCRANSE